MEYELIDEKLISETELKEKYLDYVDTSHENGKKLLEHIKKNVKINNFEETFNELNALNLGIREDYLRMIIDVAPSSVDQVRAILAPLKSTIKEDDIKKILAVVKKHL
jgi:DNA-directed RNA polymerase subunit F